MGNSINGAALGTVYILHGLISALLAKGLLTKDEVSGMLDATLYTIEKAQADDIPENAHVWVEARDHIEQIIGAHVLE